MIRAAIRLDAWTVEVWEEAAPVAAPSEDQSLVVDTGGGLRVAAIDGVTGTSLTRSRIGLSGGLWAAAVLRAALQAQDSLRACVEQANCELYEPGIAGRDQAQASVLCADLRDTRVELLRGGDCDAWVRRGRSWRQPFRREMLALRYRNRLLAWRRAVPQASHDDIVERERVLLAEPDAWNSTPVGRFAVGKFDLLALEGVDEVVVASDGARLNAQRVRRLDHWLSALRRWESERRNGLYTHGDVVVIRVRPRRGACGNRGNYADRPGRI